MQRRTLVEVPSREDNDVSLAARVLGAARRKLCYRVAEVWAGDRRLKQIPKRSPEMSETTVSSPYAGRAQQLILRDVLAIDRTRLANERTLLAWLRTALMLLVSGVTLLKLFEGILVMEVLGAVLIPAGIFAGGLGLRRYLRTRTLIEAADKD